MLGFPSSAPFPRKFPTRFDLTLGLLDRFFFHRRCQGWKDPSQQEKIPPHFFLGGAWLRQSLKQSLTKIRLPRHDHDMTFVCHPSFSDPLGAPIWPSESKSCRRKSSKNRSCRPETSGIPPQESPWKKALKMIPAGSPNKKSHQLKSGKSCENHPPLFLGRFKM